MVKVDVLWLVLAAGLAVAAMLVAAAWRSRARRAEQALRSQGAASKDPEDEEQEEAEAYAVRRGAVFVERHRPELAALVLTYDDDEAEDRFEALRDRFWSRSWDEEELPTYDAPPGTRNPMAAQADREEPGR